MLANSSGPHRAFMGVSIMLIVGFTFALMVGWRWYFHEIENRRTIIDLAAKEEARAVAVGFGASSPVPPLGGNPVGRAVVPLSGIAPGASNPVESSSLVPQKSEIKELSVEAIQPEVNAAEGLMLRYWGAKTWENRVPLVRDANRVKRLMQTFYENQAGTDPMAGQLQSVGRFMINETEVLHFAYESARPSGVLEVALVRDLGGAFRLDWESCVGYGDKTFVQMRLQRPTEPSVLRVMAMVDDYYNFEFDDPDKFICVKMLSPDGGYSLFGYAERAGEIGRWLEREVMPQRGLRGLTVQVAYPENAQSDQCLEIRRIVEDRWLLLP